MSSIKNDKTTEKKAQPEPDLENQIQNETTEENTNKPNDECNKDTHIDSPKFKEGDEIETNYRGRGRWFPGKIYRINQDGTYHIKYDDGDSIDTTEDLIRIKSEDKKIQSKHKFKEGDEVEANYCSRGFWFSGK